MKTLTRLSLIFFLFLTACAQRTPNPNPNPIPTRPPAVYLPVIGNPTLEAAQTGYPPATEPQPAMQVTPNAGAAPVVTAFHRNGQTFLTWPERADLSGEVYRVYRSPQPVTADTLRQAQFLIQLGKDSARVWGNYYQDMDVYYPRYTERFIYNRGAHPLEQGTGALVWTLAPEDFAGQASGVGYYAVTYTPKGGSETFSAAYTSPAVEEAVGYPEPLEISFTPGIHPGDGAHFYLQYMDLRHWNATFHAPNNTNEYYGFDPQQPDLANALAYVYDYGVFEPTPALCGGKVPDTLPVMVFLHGWRDNRYPTMRDYPYPYCAYGVYPVDQTQTWYFGFARDHDFRTNTPIQAGDVIENYTEQRVLRMVADLMRYPPGEPKVDPQRVYLFGHSMGGTGALAFAERYPNVFAATYSGQPVTDFYPGPGIDVNWPQDASLKWGAPALNLPIYIAAPNDWAAHLQKYNGASVYEWQNLRSAFDQHAKINRTGDEMAPFGIDHGTIDEAVRFPTQGQPVYPLLVRSGRAWAGGIVEAVHTWSVFGWPLPNLAKQADVPFWNFQVIRDETVPGLSNLSGNDPNPPTGPTVYNQTILWSASWNAWDGAPVDQPERWQMSFCAVEVGSQQCGGAADLSAVATASVDITPRRLQRFRVTPGQKYQWENRAVSATGSGSLLASGTVTAGANGLLTIPGVQIPPGGSRLEIRPGR